jgi:hypothetical protein
MRTLSIGQIVGRIIMAAFSAAFFAALAYATFEIIRTQPAIW